MGPDWGLYVAFVGCVTTELVSMSLQCAADRLENDLHGAPATNVACMEPEPGRPARRSPPAWFGMGRRPELEPDHQPGPSRINSNPSRVDTE